MTPAAMIEAARKDGVTFTLSSPDAIKLAGSKFALKRWLPLIRQNKPALLALLVEEAAAANSGVGCMLIDPLAVDDELADQAELAPLQANDPTDQDHDLRQCDIDAAVSGYSSLPPEKVSRPTTFGDERRTCTQCRNLMPSGRCAAAARGELNAMRTYEPVPDLLMRCAGFLPEPGDLEQRTGRERHWPA